LEIQDRFGRLEAAQEQMLGRHQEMADKVQTQDGRMERMEEGARDHQSLVLAVEKVLTQRLEEVAELAKENYNSTCVQMRNLRGDLSQDKESVWSLVLEIYSTLRGSTLVLKSEGAVKDHQADVLGVYRMADSYNERPVYKQDGGENYIYYSAVSCSWLVGTTVGHHHSWLRNSSSEAGTSRWVPDLKSGWEYRPLVRSSEDFLQSSSWRTDDGSLRIEPLRDMERLNELIRDIKNSREVD